MDNVMGKQTSECLQEPIAVIGLACRLPGNCNSPTSFWDFLDQGGIAHNQAPESRFNLETHHDDYKKPKTMRSPGGMFLESIDPQTFDAQFFGISGVDAIAMDPQQRQLLEVVYECLENAGITLEALDGKDFGCFVGSFAVDYGDMQARDPEDRPPTITVGAGRAILSNRISHFLNIKGPSMTIDTACSGALVSVDVACRYLNTREISGAIIAASNLYLSPEHVMDEGSMRGVASTSGKCHTFDIKADGYIKAEAVNAVILKRLDDAIRDGDPIRAVIRGSATNSDGRTPGIASPSSEAQAAAIQSAYRRAGITDIATTAYVECHGTGTQAGDRIEVAGVASVFSKYRTIDTPLIIGSVKSNIGHSEPAAGISGLIKAILSIEKGQIPRNPTFETPNPKIDFETLKLRVPKSTIRWPKGAFRRASVNSFGYGGSNAHVVIDNNLDDLSNRPHISSYTTDWEALFADSKSKKPHTIVVSANDLKSVHANCKALCDHLSNPGVVVKLSNLAYTLSERRTHHFHRAYVVTNSTNINKGGFVFGKKSTKPPRIGFVFTGQGAQWPQMGKSLIQLFPAAASMISRLDRVLQGLPNPPPWSLLSELREPREAVQLRLPEFSQPLVTALQLAILAVLESWDVNPVAVVGHSSGEIAAAYAGGLLSPEEAIKIAYFRGQACKITETSRPLGMLAAGLGPKDVIGYLSASDGMVQIACFNSPNSVTLSGDRSGLERIKLHLSNDGHFARMLQVDFAYHSNFMTGPAASYKEMLQKHCQPPLQGRRGVEMFSSVTGTLLDRECDHEYWKTNMTSPVLFDKAVTTMLNTTDGPDFLIEIGPSGALAGPIGQIKNSLGDKGSEIQYCAALARGKDAIKALFDVAGRLFVSGSPVNFSKVNEDQNLPSVIVDLPNYSWNHSTRYWHESESSKDWRFRKFPHHDLLGSKILGTSWDFPSWKKNLRVENLKWLKDHKMGEDIVFPAAGFIAMAIEALYQARQATDPIDEDALATQYRYRLRNATFPKALVLQENGQGTKVMLSLSHQQDSWYQFIVSSLVGETWGEHGRGLIRLERATRKVAPESVTPKLTHTTPGQMWYKAMNDAGYNFGPVFQKHIEVETRSGVRKARSKLSLSEPEEEYKQSYYPMHPVCIDGCLQTVSLALFRGNKSDVDAVLIPAIIDSIIIIPSSTKREFGLAVTSSKYAGIGRPEVSKNFTSDVAVYDPISRDLLFEVAGIHYHQLDVLAYSKEKDTFGRTEWKPDIACLTGGMLPDLAVSTHDDRNLSTINRLIDIVAHKIPNLTVLEANMSSGDQSSIWLDGRYFDIGSRAACKGYTFASSDPGALMNAEEKWSTNGNVNFDLIDFTRRTPEDSIISKFDLIVIKVIPSPEVVLENVVQNIRARLNTRGYVLFVDEMTSTNLSDGSPAIATPDSDTELTEDVADAKQLPNEIPPLGSDSEDGVPVNEMASSGISAEATEVSQDALHVERALEKYGFKITKFHTRQGSIYLANTAPEGTTTSPTTVHLVHLAPPTELALAIQDKLTHAGWTVLSEQAPLLDLPPRATILVISELSSPILANVDGEQWQAIKDLTSADYKILWVTAGSQLSVSEPDNALIHGLARTMRAEDPLLRFVTLDVEQGSGDNVVTAISRILHDMVSGAGPAGMTENEYVERGGVIYISRVVPEVRKDDRDLESRDLHNSESHIQLRCERVGTLDSLCWAETSDHELPFGEGMVEVEVLAAGLNFKDLAVTMGIVPENEHLLGLEGAGVISRVGRSVQSINVGRRVLFHNKGAFANRLRLSVKKVHPIPESMSFEDAASMPSVYLVVIYSLLHLAHLRKNQRVLIHSASGGVGVAAIQLCQYIGAEIFATIGSDTKRTFLTDSFAIPSSHIFSSRSIDFASGVMAATEGRGVDVILNSLTGELLDESWRCVADGGTMVEIGKKDLLARNNLSMEPFNRNATYHGVDMSHGQISDEVIGKLLAEMMDLVAKGHIRPIAPLTVFQFEEIDAAFHFLRQGSHVGKVVISSGDDRVVNVEARPATPEVVLRRDGSYLIVGGLKGLCGSLAIYMARLGAKHLVIMCRSGYEDEKSQTVLANVTAEGCKFQLFEGDVSNLQDVKRVFKQATIPIRGVIQGAMVLRDKIYASMTAEEFHECITCKVRGTWNIHNASLEQSESLDFFAMLSSISGVIGQKGQANYAAANAFLDSFATYRQGLGLPALSIDLGVIEDVGYVAERSDLQASFDTEVLSPINERLLHKILRLSLLMQTSKDFKGSSAQLITGLVTPQQETSPLLRDVRFASLAFGDNASKGHTSGSDSSREIRALFLLLDAKAEHSTLMAAMVDIISRQLTGSLRLSEPMEPGKPFTSYGIDSLAAVEFRNWLRMELGAELTTLEIVGAASLFALCEKLLGKLVARDGINPNVESIS